MKKLTINRFKETLDKKHWNHSYEAERIDLSEQKIGLTGGWVTITSSMEDLKIVFNVGYSLENNDLSTLEQHHTITDNTFELEGFTIVDEDDRKLDDPDLLLILEDYPQFIEVKTLSIFDPKTGVDSED